jgi:hypothetical protein
MADESLYTTQVPDSLDNAEATYVMGTEMVFAENGVIKSVRWRSATNAISTSPSALVYDTAGSLLASKAASGLVAGNQWNTITLDTPLAVTAGTYYVPAFGPINRYSALAGMHASADVTNGTITAPRNGVGGHLNGRFIASAVAAFPTSSGGSGYFVDVVYEADDEGVTGALAATLPELTATGAGTSVVLAGDLAASLPQLAGALVGVAEDLDPGGLNVARVMQELADQLGTITGLRVFAFPPGALVPPAAVVGYPDQIVYDATYGRGMDRMTVPVVVVVGKAQARGTVARIGQYANSAGSTSIKAVLESGTYTAFDTLRVATALFDAVTIGGTEYMAALFDVDIAGSGGGTP